MGKLANFAKKIWHAPIETPDHSAYRYEFAYPGSI